MRLNSRRWLDNNSSNQQSAISNQPRRPGGRTVVLVAGCWLLVAALSGCESLQKKFTRKPKHAQEAPTPIINFQDYTKAMTPLDRYRKHSLMFDYWNSELIGALQSPPLNPKRYKRASSESLTELQTLQGLLAEELAARLAALVEDRAKLDERLQREDVGVGDVGAMRQALESQERQIHREYFWRDVQDKLKERD